MAQRFRGNAHCHRTGTESKLLLGLHHLVTDRLTIRFDGPRPVGAEAAAPRWNQGAHFRLIGFREGLGEQMRKTVRGTLREAREHLGIQIPILRLVLRSEDAALGGSVKTFLQVRRVDAPEELFECDSSGGARRPILCPCFARNFSLDLPNTPPT